MKHPDKRKLARALLVLISEVWAGWYVPMDNQFVILLKGLGMRIVASGGNLDDAVGAMGLHCETCAEDKNCKQFIKEGSELFELDMPSWQPTIAAEPDSCEALQRVTRTFGKLPQSVSNLWQLAEVNL